MGKSIVAITGIGKWFYRAMLLVALLSLIFDFLYYGDLSFTVRYPVLSFALYMTFGLLFPGLLAREKAVQRQQQTRLRRSRLMAALLNEQWGQAVQTKELPATIVCPICKTHLITDTHYQICGDCKKEYIGEIQRVRGQRYRARQAGEPATLTVTEWLLTLQTFHFLCAYCQKTPFAVMEHYQPIGAGVGTTKENCLPACVNCNGKKSNKRPE